MKAFCERKNVYLPYAVFIVILGLIANGQRFSRPKLYGDAIPIEDLDPRNNGTQRKIVLTHNFFRARVNPPASDMLMMTWYDEAAEDAQRWAESCQLLVHDNVTGRWTDDYGSCGQNIFVANIQVPWFFAIKVWFAERMNFTYDEDVNDPNVVGHYTQMVWYSSHRIGCGFHYCGPEHTITPYYSYVCNYCPIGNHPQRFNRPYTSGKPCSQCGNDQCKFRRLCTNGCRYADLWLNCDELNGTWHNWLCDDPESDRYEACRATCLCPGSIR